AKPCPVCACASLRTRSRRFSRCIRLCWPAPLPRCLRSTLRHLLDDPPEPGTGQGDSLQDIRIDLIGILLVRETGRGDIANEHLQVLTPQTLGEEDAQCLV